MEAEDKIAQGWIQIRLLRTEGLLRSTVCLAIGRLDRGQGTGGELPPVQQLRPEDGVGAQLSLEQGAVLSSRAVEVRVQSSHVVE